VSPKNREPLIETMEHALKSAGCSVIHRPEANEAPFRFTFETPYGERLGIVAYAFRANTRLTKNRPEDEHRFQMKYGSKVGGWHDLWQDPFGLYTTLLVGINPEQGFFVSADPVLHSPTRLFISIEFKQEHVDEILAAGWHGWERPRRTRTGDPIEVLVGGKMESFLRLVRFERDGCSRLRATREGGWRRHHPALQGQPPHLDRVQERAETRHFGWSAAPGLPAHARLQGRPVLPLL
jgi:hypothetical protein